MHISSMELVTCSLLSPLVITVWEKRGRLTLLSYPITAWNENIFAKTLLNLNFSRSNLNFVIFVIFCKKRNIFFDKNYDWSAQL